MGSGAGGLGPVASEPGKGSFPLPFLFTLRGAGPWLSKPGQGRKGEGADAAYCIAFAVPPGIPPTRSLATLSRSPGTPRNTSEDCVSALHRTAWSSAPACRRAARTQPPPQVLGTRAALVHVGAAVVGTTRHHRLPSNPVPELWQTAGGQPWTQKNGCFALLPGLFPGPSPRPAPNGSSSHSPVPRTICGSPKLLTSCVPRNAAAHGSLLTRPPPLRPSPCPLASSKRVRQLRLSLAPVQP